MSVDYMPAIVSYVPQVLFLDGVKLDGNGLKNNYFDLTGALQIFGIRIIGIKKPSNETFDKKKIKHTFYLELECPLLDSKLKTWTPEEIKSEDNFKDETSKELELNKQKKSKNPKSKPTIKDKKNKPENVNEFEDLFNRIILEDKLIPGSSNFKSVSKTWENVLQFSEPSIVIPVEKENLDLLRDVFRTSLTLRLIHLKTILPNKKKEKANKIKNKKERGNSIINTEELPKEITISKTLLAKIILPLKSINWNEESLDYSWSKTSPMEAKFSQNIKSIKYTAKKSGKGKQSKNTNTKDMIAVELPLPNVLTCHIGVGIKRFKN
uniref:Uncharacterized protein n=2 Tax=Clastoptera arizonana TaxID=38151 RepID=A0A1B6BW21_9HEMI